MWVATEKGAFSDFVSTGVTYFEIWFRAAHTEDNHARQKVAPKEFCYLLTTTIEIYDNIIYPSYPFI